MKQKKITFIGLMACTLLFLANTTFSQSVNISNSATSAFNTLGNSEYHVSEYIYSDAEIGASNFITAGTAINRIQLSCTTVGAPTSFGNVKIYMQNVAIGTTTFTTGTYSTAGYTTVYSGSFSVTSVGPITIDLTTPFIRTTGTNLQVMIERADGIAKGATTNFIYGSINTVGSSSRRYNGATALSGSTSLSPSGFRAAITLIHVFNNDLGVDRIETLGKIPTVAAFPHSVKALVTNYGLNAIPSGTNITLNVSGANTISNVQTTSSIAPGASQTITFAAINSMVVGTNTISVTAPTDENTANNTASFTQTVVNTGVSYADGANNASNVGFNTGSGILANLHNLPNAITITAVRVFITTTSNTVFGVVCDANGVVLGQSSDYAVVPADSLTYKTFTLSSPVNIPANTNFFIGLGQKTGAYGYFPVGSQTENPTRANTFASMPTLTGGVATYYTTLGRFMIEAVINQVNLPISLIEFKGSQNSVSNMLQWTTSTEINNAGFEIQRSSNATNFTSIGNMVSKSITGNSNTITTYDFIDFKPLTGTNYYRLKQLDKDGKFSYSSVVTLKSNKLVSPAISAIYPNPVKDRLTITIGSPSAENVSLVISDLSGKILRQRNIALTNGEVSIFENTSNLATGTYLIKLVSEKGTKIETKKIVKQ